MNNYLYLSGLCASYFMNWFFHGHVPGKNTLTRRIFRRKPAKPRRSVEPNCRKEPSEAVLWQSQKADGNRRLFTLFYNIRPKKASIVTIYIFFLAKWSKEFYIFVHYYKFQHFVLFMFENHCIWWYDYTDKIHWRMKNYGKN